MESSETNSYKEGAVKKVRVPVSFKTERGSTYEYFADGSGYTERRKHDRTEHITRGVTVFVSEETAREASRIYAEKSHLPKEKQFTYYLMEDKGDHGDYIWQASQIENPDKLLLVKIDGKNTVRAKYKAELTPQIGSFPFQQSLKNDKPNFHLGDKVIKIDASQSIVINLASKAAQVSPKR